jgi:hypothetical protein
MARPKLPDKNKATKEDYIAFVKWGIKHNSSPRRGHFRTWEQCRLYPIGEQWLTDNSGEFDSRMGTAPALKPIQVPKGQWYPMPVQNELAAPLQNEVANLMGAGSKAYVRPSRSDSKRVKAAEMSRDVLSDRLTQLGWISTQHRGLNSLVQYGTMVLKSWWELDFTDMVQIPAKGAHRCPACGSMLSDLAAPADKASEFVKTNPERASAITVSDTEATVVSCLSCDAGQPLSPFQPDPEQISMLDVFGRTMYEEVPRGDTAISVVSVYDFFPENQGLGIEDKNLTEWWEERIESVDWIRSHYREGYKVKPETIDVARYHPCVGSAQGFQNSDEKDGTWEHHAIVREFHKKPWVEVDEQGNPKANRGRSIIVSNGVVLLDDDYMRESLNHPGVFIPRVVYTTTPWEIREREIFGVSLPEYCFSGQDTINTTLSQVEDARHKMGSPRIKATEGMEISFAGFEETGYPSDIVRFIPDPLMPGGPDVMGNVQMAQGWISEVEMQRSAIGRACGSNDIDVGNAPGKDLTAASAIMYLGEKSAVRRKPRVERIKEAKRKIYRHQLQMIHEFYREERMYSVLGKNDRWTIKSFQGADLMGETDVQFEDEQYFDARMFRREVIKDGVQIGSISLDTADAKRKINKELGIPLEINEELNQQVERAEEEWFQFYEENRQPAVSPRSDDPVIHYQNHELSLRSEDGRRLMDECGWNDVELALWGWEDKLLAMESMEQSLKQPPPPAPVPGPGPAGEPEEGDLDPKTVEQYQQSLQVRAQMEQAVAQFPKAPELRVYLIWSQMLAPLFAEPQIVQDPLAPASIPDPERWQKILRVLRWKAHIEAHYRDAQRRATAAQAGIPMPAAPGSAETSAGLTPTPGQVAIPGPGAGPGATTGSGSGGQ